MGKELSASARTLFDSPEFVVMATIDPDGRPQQSVVWAERDGNDVIVSTVEGRRKHRNLVRDPRATLLLHPKDAPYTYVEIRGHVTMSHEGGRELIDRLARKYTGAPRYTADDGTDAVRVVLRVTPDQVVEHGIAPQS